jgi:hypothetical protein
MGVSVAVPVTITVGSMVLVGEAVGVIGVISFPPVINGRKRVSD